MNQQRPFPLGDILSLTTGRLMLSPRHMGAVLDILTYMTGQKIIYDIPRAADTCRPAILHQHPQLAGLTPPAGNDIAVLRAWVEQMRLDHGVRLLLSPLAPGVWRSWDPLADIKSVKVADHPGPAAG